MEKRGSDGGRERTTAPAKGAVISALQERIETRRATVSVLGLGYVGLPICLEAAEAGYTVTGFDIDNERVGRIAAGRSYLVDVDDSRLTESVRRGSFSVTDDFSAAAGADVYVICVPTPLTANQVPDMSHIRNAAERIASRIDPGSLVILESTTYPGCTREELLPVIERTGMRVGEEFLLAFSPERVSPGSGHDHTATPKLVGGITDTCRAAAAQFYRGFFTEVVEVSSAEVAETAKLLENVYRSVNIALVNELAIICNRMGLSVWEVIDAAATKPFGFTPFYPGPGLGGHCIPIDPFYFSWKARELGLATEFVELAGKVNTRMPEYVVERVAAILNEHSRSIRGSSILLLGAAYKQDVADMRESPALRVAELLINKGAEISYHDPHVESFELDGHRIENSPLTRDSLVEADCVVILTPHRSIDWELVAKESELILDTRNVVPHDGRKSFSI